MERRAYALWAIEEIILRIYDDLYQIILCPGVVEASPIREIIEEFMDKFDDCYENSENERARLVFSTAYDTARDILYLL